MYSKNGIWWSRLCTAICASAISCGANASDWSNALRFESDDKAYSFRIGGRLHADIGSIDADDPASDGSFDEIRRARLNLSGKFLRDWRYFYEYDFAADHDFQVKDAYIGYYGFDRVRIRLGNLQEPVSLEELTSSNATTFMERALINALVPGYNLGLRINSWGEDWSLAGGLFEGSARGRDKEIDEGWGVAGRVVYSPRIGRGNRLHFGVSSEYREPREDNRVSYRTRPEVHLIDRAMIATGTLSRVDHTLTSGLELAGIWGSWSIQGEYIRADVQRTGRPDVVFDGWYLLGSWFITGGRRDYDPKDGAFDKVVPKADHGDWEIAARYSTLDLEQDPITGGEEKNWTLGLNWYVDRHMRLMANYVDAEADPNRSGSLERLKAWMFRFQYIF